MTYNAIKGRFSHRGPDKKVHFGSAKQYIFKVTPEQGEQLDKAVFAWVRSTKERRVSLSIDEKLTLSDEELAQHTPALGLRFQRHQHNSNQVQLNPADKS